MKQLFYYSVSFAKSNWHCTKPLWFMRITHTKHSRVVLVVVGIVKVYAINMWNKLTILLYTDNIPEKLHITQTTAKPSAICRHNVCTMLHNYNIYGRIFRLWLWFWNPRIWVNTLARYYSIFECLLHSHSIADTTWL